MTELCIGESIKMKRSDIPDEVVCWAYWARKFYDLECFSSDILAKMYPDHPEKVIYAAMRRADDHGYIEYGVSLRGGWLTDKGKAFVKTLESSSVDWSKLLFREVPT